MFEPSRRSAAQRAAARAHVRWRAVAVLGATLLMATAVVAAVAPAHGGSAKRTRAVAAPNVRPGGRARARAAFPSTPPVGSGENADAQGRARIEQLAALGFPVYCGGPRGNELALTFDDGPGPYTYLALRKLTQAHERATFFVVGRSMESFPGWVQRERSVAAIGDHTYQHLGLAELSRAEITNQISKTKQMIERAIGQPPLFFRPPYGAHDATVDSIVEHLGLLQIMWSADSADSLGADWAGIIRNVEVAMRPGAIILMHENRGQTIRALTTLLPELHRRHLRSVSLPELFASDPPSMAQVLGGRSACPGGPTSLRGNGS